MKKIVVFPYHPDINILFEFNNLLKDTMLCGVLSYYEDRHIVGPLNNALGISKVSDIDMIQNCDALIIVDNYRNYKIDKYYEIFNIALKYNKDIYITPLAIEQLNLKQYTGKYHKLEFIPNGFNSINEEFSIRQKTNDPYIYDIDIPIVAIMGQGKNCGKFHTQLLFSEILNKKYAVASICTNALGILFGCYSIPSFLYSNISFQEKIIKFNYYIHRIKTEISPDIIVLGIPEGIFPFEKKEYNHFAEYPLVITNAVSIDMSVLCSYFSPKDWFMPDYQSIINTVQARFLTPVNAIAISRTSFDVPDDDNENIFYNYLDKEYIEQQYPKNSDTHVPTISLINKADAVKAIENLINKLENNIQVI